MHIVIESIRNKFRTTLLNNALTCLSTLNVVGDVNTSGLSVFTINSNVNNLNSTSNTIFNNLNDLSIYSKLSIDNLNATSTTLFNKTDGCCEDAKQDRSGPSPLGPGLSSKFYAQGHPRYHGDGLKDTDLAGPFVPSVLAPDHLAGRSWMPRVSSPCAALLSQAPIRAAAPAHAIPPPQLAGQGSTAAFLPDSHQVPRPMR